MSRTLKEDMQRYLLTKKRVRPCQLIGYYCLSRTRIHQVPKELLKEGKVVRSGKIPKTYYRIVRNLKVGI